MRVKEMYGNFGKAELFNLSQNGGMLLKNVEEGCVMKLTGAVIMVDDRVVDGGELKEKEILHLRTEDRTYTTESPTVIKTFRDAVTFMETSFLTFKLTRSQSKNGRTFMNLQLMDEPVGEMLEPAE